MHLRMNCVGDKFTGHDAIWLILPGVTARMLPAHQKKARSRS